MTSQTNESSFAWTASRVMALVVLCAAALLDTVDVTIVNVAMPTIRDALGFSEGGLAWMVNAYMVPFGGFLLLAGRAGDYFGRRRVLLAGTGLFTFASLASGLSGSVAFIVASRAIQGLAAAFVVPTTLAMLSSTFPAGAARNRAFAIWGGVSAIAGTLGLVLGGLIVSALGWRWVFFINIPLGILVLAGAVRFLPSQRRDLTAERTGFDLLGAVAATLGASMLAYAVVQAGGGNPWSSARTIGFLVAAVVLLGYFLAHERFWARHPLLPMSLWRNRSVTGANVVAVLQSSAVFTMFYATTLYLQQVRHFSALRTGAAYVPLGASILVAAGIGPMLVNRFGVRLTIVAGSAITAVGMLLLVGVSTHGALLSEVEVPLVVIGLGTGMVLIPSLIAALSGVPHSLSGTASGLLNASRQLGGALGLAAISSAITSRTMHALTTGQTAGEALTNGFRTGFVISAVLMVVAVGIAIALMKADGRGQTIDLVELQAAGASDGTRRLDEAYAFTGQQG